MRRSLREAWRRNETRFSTRLSHQVPLEDRDLREGRSPGQAMALEGLLLRGLSPNQVLLCIGVVRIETHGFLQVFDRPLPAPL